VHPVLLKGQSLTVERPQRTTGTAVGAAACALAVGLGVALLIRALNWPVSFPSFLAYLGAAGMAVLALLFAFWTYSCVTMRYVLDGNGLTVRWGPIKHFIAIDRVQAVAHGRGEQRPRISGLGWWGYHVGRGEVDGQRTLFFSTHRSGEEIVYVKTAGLTYALSPQDADRFTSEINRLRQSTRSDRASGIEREILAAHPIWADHVAQALAVVAVLLNIALWGYIFAAYPDLDREITIEFPPIGDITTLHERAEVLKIPLTATAFLAMNLFAGLVFQWKERAATYLVLSGTIFFQVIFWVAAAVAVINA